MLRAREHAHHKEGRNALSAIGVGSLKRLAFPVVALVLVLILRKVLKGMQWDHISLLELAVPLLVSWALVRVLVYLLRCIFFRWRIPDSFRAIVDVGHLGRCGLEYHRS